MSKTILVDNPSTLRAAVERATGGETFVLREAGTPYAIHVYGPQNTVKGHFDAPIRFTSENPDRPVWVSHLYIREVGNVIVDNVHVLADEMSASWTYQNVLYRATDIRLDSITFEGAARGLHDGSAGTVRGNTSMRIIYSSDIEVKNSLFTNSFDGITTEFSSNINIIYNEFTRLQQDGIHGTAVKGINIVGNLFHDFLGVRYDWHHSDMIQYWVNNPGNTVENMLIADNVIMARDGFANQTILLTNSVVNQGGGLDQYYKNITITNNLIYNGQGHGAYVESVDGLTITNNTMVRNDMAGVVVNTTYSASAAPPIIQIIGGTRNAIVDRNVTDRIIVTNSDVAVGDNIDINYQNRTGAYAINKLFVNVEGGGAKTLADFGPRPGGLIDIYGHGWDPDRKTARFESAPIVSPAPTPDPAPEPAIPVGSFAEAAKAVVNGVTLDTFSFNAAEDRGRKNWIDEDAGTFAVGSNSWRTVAGDFKVTADTVLSFDFKPGALAPLAAAPGTTGNPFGGLGEMHMIAFETDATTTERFFFNLYGDQRWGLRDYRYTGDGDWQSFSIRVGDHFRGDFSRMAFISDDDADVHGDGSASFFRNVQVREAPRADAPIIPAVDFTEAAKAVVNGVTLDTFSFNAAEDRGRKNWIDEDAGTFAVGSNSWRTVAGDFKVTADTVLSFDFKPGALAPLAAAPGTTGNPFGGLGEMHMIAFETDATTTERFFFNLYGDQRWGLRDYRYTGDGDWQSFSIRVGDHFRGDFSRMAFISDDDADVHGDGSASFFRNVRIYDSGELA